MFRPTWNLDRVDEKLIDILVAWRILQANRHWYRQTKTFETCVPEFAAQPPARWSPLFELTLHELFNRVAMLVSCRCQGGEWHMVHATFHGSLHPLIRISSLAMPRFLCRLRGFLFRLRELVVLRPELLALQPRNCWWCSLGCSPARGLLARLAALRFLAALRLSFWRRDCLALLRLD